MKTICALACILVALAANAQPPRAEGSLESQLASQVGKASSLAAREIKPSEVVKGKVIYGGLVVELVKTGNPLRLITSPAPPQYTLPEDHTTRNWSRGTHSAFTLFAIRF